MLTFQKERYGCLLLSLTYSITTENIDKKEKKHVMQQKISDMIINETLNYLRSLGAKKSARNDQILGYLQQCISSKISKAMMNAALEKSSQLWKLNGGIWTVKSELFKLPCEKSESDVKMEIQDVSSHNSTNSQVKI